MSPLPLQYKKQNFRRETFESKSPLQDDNEMIHNPQNMWKTPRKHTEHRFETKRNGYRARGEKIKSKLKMEPLIRAQIKFAHEEIEPNNIVTDIDASELLHGMLLSSPSLKDTYLSSHASSWPAKVRSSLPNSRYLPEKSSTGQNLSTSAPISTKFHSRNKREVRPMTLLDCASIYNESGDLLDHENFTELSISPDIHPSQKRKGRKRVGKLKQHLKKKSIVASDNADRLYQDDITLQLVIELLPQIDVRQELNIKLLEQANAHSGDVFSFDDDMNSHSNALNMDSAGCNSLSLETDLDILAFRDSVSQLAASATIFVSTDDDSSLSQQIFSNKWIYQTILNIILQDICTQQKHFTVIAAIFRTLPHTQMCILDAIESAAYMIYQHQPLFNRISSPQKSNCISVKGILTFLTYILALERNKHEYNNSTAEFSERAKFCSSVLRIIKLLVRSACSSSSSRSDNNPAEKFKQGSESIEAATTADICDLLQQLFILSPGHGEEFLHWVTLKWPERCMELQIFYVRYIDTVLTLFMELNIDFSSYELVDRIFTRIEICLVSPLRLLVEEAIKICNNLPLMSVYLSHYPVLRERIAGALHENITKHWSSQVRQLSDDTFDALLDFA